MTTTSHSRRHLRLVDPCVECGLDPCACHYIAKLRRDGELAHLRSAALEEYPKPVPHRAACPCPKCYSIRLATWTTDQRQPTTTSDMSDNPEKTTRTP